MDFLRLNGVLMAGVLGACAADGGALETADAAEAVAGKADLVTVRGELEAVLPVLESPEIGFNPAPGLAAVQPTASLKFSYASCGTRSWTVKRERQETILGPRVLLQIEDANPIDCLAVPTLRAYEVQISSDAFEDRDFVILNPTGLSLGALPVVPVDECPDATDPNVHYIANSDEDPSICTRIFFTCERAQQLFTNECGCGCIDIG